MKEVWLTWHHQARSRNLAKVFNVDIAEIFINKNLLIRHLFSSIWTIFFLIKHRPKTIIIQLSFLLLVIVRIYKLFCFNKIKVIADCHTKALRRKSTGLSNYIFWPIKKWSFKRVDLSIISNEGNIEDIEQLNKSYKLLPDKIPNVNFKIKKIKKPYVVYVSAFAVDEPFDEIFEVAKILEGEVDIYWTGKLRKDIVVPKNKPSNIKFTGFISFEDYYDLIGNAKCILALTTEQDCLQSGAYEALAVNVPMVISDTIALKKYFRDSAYYTNHFPENIADNIKKIISNSSIVKQKSIEIKKIRDLEFDQQLKSIINFIR